MASYAFDEFGNMIGGESSEDEAEQPPAQDEEVSVEPMETDEPEDAGDDDDDDKKSVEEDFDDAVSEILDEAEDEMRAILTEEFGADAFHLDFAEGATQTDPGTWAAAGAADASDGDRLAARYGALVREHHDYDLAGWCA